MLLTTFPGLMGAGEAAARLAGRTVWAGATDPGLSGALDGEGVQVVGQDRPAGPDPLALVTLEAAAPQVVAALEVADAALAAGPVAGQPLAGASGAGLGPPGDERPRRCQACQGLLGRTRHEAAIQRDLTRARPRRFSSAAVCSSRRFSPGLPGGLPVPHTRGRRD